MPRLRLRKTPDTNQMIVDVPAVIQMAIYYRMIDDVITVGDVVERAVRLAYPTEVACAEKQTQTQSLP